MHPQRIWKWLVAAAVIIAAVTLTFGWPRKNGLANDIDPNARARAARERDPYDLRELAVLNPTILKIKEHYVDPKRVDPQRMLLAGLNAIQRSVAPVLVDYQEDKHRVSIQVNDKSRTFPTNDVKALWKLTPRFREIFGFIQDNLNDEEVKMRDVEYSAVNGMLQTLDPHTVLLTPDVFEEMQMNTRGEFGGLGIVISIRDGFLTVIRPMPNTPATRAGLQRGDRVVKINEESTLNMPLSEAVDRLRGPPGSPVSVWVKRKNGSRYSNQKRVDLVRDVIHIESVESRMLRADNKDSGIGYVKINSFQKNTYEDMRRALTELSKKKMKGLVLDLRDNPGGLLDSAARIADSFLTQGSLVTTSSNDPRERDEQFAREAGTEPNYPITVLINGASASASEIVAGALKNHDRAVIVGQNSFGKGSVQVLFNFPDSSALKLTIAQYLTPGDISIQGVGIVPDIGIDPMTVDSEDMDLAVNKMYLRESDLQSHLTNDRARASKAPDTVLRYYLGTDTRQRLREAEPNEEENEKEDEFLLRFSRMLLSRSTTSNRLDMLAEAKSTINLIREQEMKKATAELKKLGVDWSVGTDDGASKVTVEATTDRPGNIGAAGEPFSLKVKVTNTGDKTLYQLRATTKSDSRLFDSRELVFGKLAPGESREWSSTLGTCRTQKSKRVCRLPLDLAARADIINLNFEEAHGHAPPKVEVRTEVRAKARPEFAYSVQVADDVKGNGDGKLQTGESASVYLRIKNVGKGQSERTQANLRSLGGQGVLLRDGRFHIDSIKPGEERLVKFGFELLPSFDKKVAKLEVSVVDLDLRESITHPLNIAVAAPVKVTAKKGRVVLSDGAVLRSSPDAAAMVLGKVTAGGLSLPSLGQANGFVKVNADDGQSAWVATSQTGSGQGGRLNWALDQMPPQLEVSFGKDRVTRKSVIKIKGTAKDDQRVRDLYIFAGARKVHYKSNLNNGSPKELSFEADIPLHGGINYITVFARQNDDIVTRKTAVFRRDAADGSAMETPPFDADTLGAAAH